MTQSSSSLAEQQQYALAVADADMLPRGYRGKPANVLLAIGLGEAMGLTPAVALSYIYVVDGKPTASAQLITANVRRAGHKLWTEEDPERQSVTCTIVRSDMPEHPISVTRDIEWARQMGLANKDNYKKQGMTMLQWRAITACARLACPEALCGVMYTKDELHDMDGTTPEPMGKVAAPAPVAVEAVVEPVPEPAPAPKTADRLDPIRRRLPAYARATHPELARKESMLAATQDILATMGVGSMAELTDWQIETLCTAMDAMPEREGAEVE